MKHFGSRRGWWSALLGSCAGLGCVLAAAHAQTPPTMLPPPTPVAPPPLQAGGEALPIDLPTALRLADDANPTIAVARARVEEAYARLEQAKVLWLPNLQAGATYNRHDGQIQNSNGLIFADGFSNLFVGGGALAQVNTADALFIPLIERRLTQAEQANARAVSNNVQLDVALAYFDLLQAQGALLINADTLARAQEMQRRAEAAEKAQASKTTADVNRARTEVFVRLQERLTLRGRLAVAAAHLARLLLLRPTICLQAIDPPILPLMLVPESACLDDLVAQGWLNRPELASSRALVQASLERIRQARLSPLLPQLQVEYMAGTFGGGVNSTVSNFGGRGDGTASAVWELRNFGFGDLGRIRERRAQYNQASLHVVEVQAQVGEEVTAAAQIARVRFEALGAAQTAVTEALEMWRKLERSSFGLIGPKGQYDPLEPLLALQALNQAWNLYLSEVMDYNRAQFQLYTALGQPSLQALECLKPLPLQVEPAPQQPYTAVGSRQ